MNKRLSIVAVAVGVAAFPLQSRAQEQGRAARRAAAVAECEDFNKRASALGLAYMDCSQPLAALEAAVANVEQLEQLERSAAESKEDVELIGEARKIRDNAAIDAIYDKLSGIPKYSETKAFKELEAAMDSAPDVNASRTLIVNYIASLSNAMDCGKYFEPADGGIKFKAQYLSPNCPDYSLVLSDTGSYSTQNNDDFRCRFRDEINDPYKLGDMYQECEGVFPTRSAIDGAVTSRRLTCEDLYDRAAGKPDGLKYEKAFSGNGNENRSDPINRRISYCVRKMSAQ